MVILAGCGRLAFDPRHDATDAAPDVPNRAFISTASRPGGFGGTAAADDICAGEAGNAGLSGTFVSFIASAAVPDPRSRLVGSSGYVLVDGTPIGNTVESMLDSLEVFNPIWKQVDGTPLVGNASTWTGANQNGFHVPAETCNDWQDSSGAVMGTGNNVHNASWAGGSSVTCDNNRRFLCLEVGHVTTVAAVPSTGRLTFITVGKRTTALDVTDADTLCNTEATAAGFPGTYRAALTTSTASLASRFVVDSRPFIRLDGTFVAPGDVFFTGMNLTSMVHQLSDGSYTRESFWTGVTTSPQTTSGTGQTCNDWMSAGMATDAPSGQPSHTVGSAFWSALLNTCDTRLHFLCVQE
jgi:hypothetical protein